MFKELLAQPRFVALVYVLGGISLFAGCWLSLWDQDESAYAAFAWQMLETGNWLVPEFQWSEIHRKTPLYFWSIAVSNLAFGFSEWAVRLPAFERSGYSTLGWLARSTRLWPRNGFGCIRAIACQFVLPHLVKIAVTDAMLLFFETMAALAVINYFNDQQAKDRWWFVLGVAGALLVKGLLCSFLP